MIRVQTWDNQFRQIRVPGIQTGNALPTVRNAADSAGLRTLSSVLGAGEKLLDVAVREYVADETARVSQSLQQLNADLSAERERYMQENKGENAVDAGRYFEQYATRRARKYLEEGKFRGRYAEEFRKQAMGNILHFAEQGRTYGSQQREAWNASVIDGAVSDFQNQVSQNYDNDEWLEYSFGNLETMVNAMRPGRDNAAMLKDVRKNAALGVIDGYLDHDDIAGASRAVERFAPVLGGSTRALSLRVDDHAQALQARREADNEKAAREILKGYGDALSQAKVKGDTLPLDAISTGLRNLGRKEEAERISLQARQLAAVREYSVFAMNQPLPAVKRRMAELEKDLEKARSGASGDHVADCERMEREYLVLAEGYSSRLEELEKDPAAAAERSSFFHLPDKATEVDRVWARIRAQEKIGLNPSEIRPLSVQEVDAFAVQYGRASSASACMEQLRGTYGELFPAVMRQLAGSGKFPGTMSLIADMEPEAGDLLFQAGRGDFSRKTEEILGMDATDKKELHALADRALKDVNGTLTAGGNQDAAELVSQAAYDLALQYRMQGMSFREAAQRASAEVFAGRYEVRGSYRVPKPYDADAVSVGAGRVIAALTASDDVSPDLALPERHGLTSEQMRRRLQYTLNTKGRWITGRDESGLVLTMNGKAVRKKDGNAVACSFEELQRLGLSAPVSHDADSEGAMRLAGGGL